MKKPIRVLVVDDSPVVRAILADMLESEPGIIVAGQAQDGEEAVAMAASLRPDVITMDIRMPRLNGLEATKRIMSATPTAIVVVASSIYSIDLNIAFNAVAAGALTVVEKPKGLDPNDFDAVRDQLVSAVRLVADVPVVALWSGEHATRAHAPPPVSALHPGAQILAIGASTGGPGTLRQILSVLPESFPLPIVVVQHITPGFAQGFAHWLDSTTPLHVALAHDGDVVRPGHVFIAPDDAHMLVTPGGYIRLDNGAPLNGRRPAATRLFESVARTYGGAAIGLILTGMGDDGAAGLVTLHNAGSQVIAQESTSCVVSSMPDAAVARGCVDIVLAPEAIAEILSTIKAGVPVMAGGVKGPSGYGSR